MADETKNENTKPNSDEAEKVKALEGIVADVQKENKALKVRVEKLEKATGNTPIEKSEPKKKPELPKKAFTVEGKKYKFLIPSFRIGEDKYTAEAVMEDKELLAMLVEKKLFGIIQEQK